MSNKKPPTCGRGGVDFKKFIPMFVTWRIDLICGERTIQKKDKNKIKGKK